MLTATLSGAAGATVAGARRGRRSGACCGGGRCRGHVVGAASSQAPDDEDQHEGGDSAGADQAATSAVAQSRPSAPSATSSTTSLSVAVAGATSPAGSAAPTAVDPLVVATADEPRREPPPQFEPRSAGRIGVHWSRATAPVLQPGRRRSPKQRWSDVGGGVGEASVRRWRRWRRWRGAIVLIVGVASLVTWGAVTEPIDVARSGILGHRRRRCRTGCRFGCGVAGRAVVAVGNGGRHSCNDRLGITMRHIDGDPRHAGGPPATLLRALSGDNGGATAPGVAADSIKVVVYRAPQSARHRSTRWWPERPACRMPTRTSPPTRDTPRSSRPTTRPTADGSTSSSSRAPGEETMRSSWSPTPRRSPVICGPSSCWVARRSPMPSPTRWQRGRWCASSARPDSRAAGTQHTIPMSGISRRTRSRTG